MSDLGFAIVGCGAIARTHVKALADTPGARVTALVGRSASRLAEEADLDVPCFDDVVAAVAQPNVDAVAVCTPSGAHRSPAVLAARAGKHVVVEKPLEITPRRCDDIIAAADAAGVKLAAVMPIRFTDAARKLKADVDAGKFGRLTLGETTCKWWRSQEYYDSGDWRGTWDLDGGGALMNQAIHNVDLLLWLMGPAASVTGFTATLAHERIEVEDTAVAAVRFASGALGMIVATTAAHPGHARTIAVHGDQGSAAVTLDGGTSDPKAIAHESHARQYRDFVASVCESRRPAVDGREGRRAVEVIAAIYESTRTGRVVTL